MRSKNTDFCRRIEKCIADRVAERGISPSVAEIAEETGISHSSVGRYLQYLRAEGRIDYAGHRSARPSGSSGETVRVPVLGEVACGLPRFAEENIEEYVRLPCSLFGKGEFFFLRAKGDSMIGSGIDDGDLVLVRRQNFADAGQIVVALIGEEATLKRCFPEGHRVCLRPENPDFQPIYTDECEIQGVAVRVIKELR